MVSKLNSVFRHFIGSETQYPVTGSRKRPSESLDDVTQDVLETPQPKRARLSNHSDGASSSSQTTPLRKVASWIRRTASSFSETYFFKPMGDFVERSYPATVPEPLEDSRQRGSSVIKHDEICQQPNAHRPTSNKSTPTGVSFKQPGEPYVRKTLSSNPHHNVVKQSMSNSNGGHGNSDHGNDNGGPAQRDKAESLRRKQSGLESRGRSSNVAKSSLPQASNSSTVASDLSRHRNYVPVREKLFPDPKRRVVVSHISRGPKFPSNNKLAVNECVRMNEREQYQQLIQQYMAGCGLGLGQASSRPVAEGASRAQDDHMPHNASRSKASGAASNTSQRLSGSQYTAQQGLLGARVLPHQFSSKAEVREAVRLRIHAPASQLSPGTPAGERNQPPTPTQPDFSSSDSPVITSIQSPPAVSAFQKSLVSTPYLDEEWVKDLKARFESSVRIRKREIDEHENKLKHFEERRAKGQADVQEQIKARIIKAERIPGVIEDEIYRPEKEDEDEGAIEIVEEEDEGEEEGEEEEELPELTEKMDLEIDMALNPNPSSEGLVSGFRLTITRRDMQTLAGLNWLNDEIMNFYFEMLRERSNSEGYPSVHVFNTFFYPKLLNAGYASIRRWTKRVDVFSKELLLVPVHLGMHWCLAVIDFRSKSIVFYDSMGSHNQQCLDALRDYVVSEHADKKKQTYSMDGWRYYSERNVPQQMNGSDCGMFACKYAEYISRDAPITFTQHEMPYFRRRMVWEILHMKLL